MRRVVYIISLFYICLAIFVFTGCTTTKNPVRQIPLLERLKGSWTLASTNDNNALLGSSMVIYPENNDGLISFLQNNSYCVRPNEVIWKDITESNGSLHINSLSSSCMSSLIYKPASITVISMDELQLSGSTASGKPLLQTWKRIQVLPEPVKKK